MSEGLDPVIGQCKKCQTEIHESHPYAWCIGCGEPISDDINLKRKQERDSKHDRPNERITAEHSRGPDPQLYVVLSVICILAALVFAGTGWYTVYDNSSDARIVGGDAYNFIIYATRGTAIVCIGLVCAVLSVTFAVFAHMRTNSDQKSLLLQRPNNLPTPIVTTHEMSDSERNSASPAT